MTSLLDINVLVALLDSAHVHHETARRWLTNEPGLKWASCPLTQNGFIRILSLPAYPSPVSVSRAIELLQGATQTKIHEFWADDLSLLDQGIINHDMIHGSKQVTDVYLLALAVKNQGRLVSMDQSIPISSVRGSNPMNLMII